MGINLAGVDLSEKIFGVAFNEAVVHQVVVSYLAGGRSGNSAQKTRSEVRGGGRKPWRQKGTGRARAGTIRSPLWRGGGVTFAAERSDYTQKVNKKVYRLALRSIFSELLRQERLRIVDSADINQAEAKTKLLLKKLNEMKMGDNVLIIADDINTSLFLAARNLPKVKVINVEAINPVDLIGYEKVLLTLPAIKAIEEWLG